jgi:hypothetical protein
MAMVQYGLWPNCTNKCDFCLLDDHEYKTVEERLRILRIVKQNITIVDWKNKFSDGISLLGGEVFYTDSEEVKESFLDLLQLIIDFIFKKNNARMLSIVSNGMYDPNILLIPTLDLLKKENMIDKFNLNFSYDVKYRFHTEESKLQCISNINMVYDKYGIIPCVQTCLTQYLIDMFLSGEFNLFEFKDKYFPNSILTFLYPHKINTGKVLNDFFFTRASLFKFIGWMKTNGYNFELENFIQSVINSAQFKYTGLFDRSYIEDWEGETGQKKIEQAPTLERKQILTDCGHSQLYRCYSDSDKCMLCDLLKVL